ncbi:MFS transporter [Salinarimonas rosea]|uniref:MFS transporter n=1 Tax=Salinarimonas rosea TaxID=552063 RepID=UPI00040F0C54|nr:MFS transporter [Salinarimonas rosea]
MTSQATDTGAGSNALAGVLITVLLTSFVAATYGFGFYLFSQLVPDMRADLGFDMTVVGMITAAGQLGFLAFAILGAWLAPRIGGGQVVIGSVALCAACLVLLPMTDSILVVAVLLTILGGTAASVYVPMVEIVSRAIGYRHRGKVLGLVSSGTSYGVFVNSLLVPIFVVSGDWRGVWFTVGAGTFVVTLVATVTFWKLGLFRHTREPVPASGGGGFFAGMGAVMVPWVLIIWAITFLNGFSTLPFQNYLSPYLREELGFSVAFAAWVWGVIGFIGMFAGFVVGWMSDKTGVRLALLFTYVCVFAASAILVVAPTETLAIGAGVLFAVAFYPIFGLVPAYVAKTARGAQATVIFGVANVTLGVGGMVGNYVFGVVANVTGTFVWIYVAIAATAVVLAILSVVLPTEGAAEETSAAPETTADGCKLDAAE